MPDWAAWGETSLISSQLKSEIEQEIKNTFVDNRVEGRKSAST